MSERNDEASENWPWVKKIFGYSDLITSLYAAVVAAGVLYLLGIIVLALVPSWGEAEALSVTIRNFALIIGGVVGFVFAFRRLAQTDKQIEISDTEAKTRLRDEDRKDREQIAKFFSDAAVLIGNENLNSKVLGANQMAEIAVEHTKLYLDLAIRLISATARDVSLQPDDLPDREAVSQWDQPTFQHTRKSHEVSQELARIVLNLERVRQGDQFSFRENSPINLSGICFSGMRIECLGISLGRFSGCDFSSATFIDCVFAGAVPDRKELSGTYFGGCDFGMAVFEGVDLYKVTFYGCGFSGNCFAYGQINEVQFCANYIEVYEEPLFEGVSFGSAEFLENPSIEMLDTYGDFCEEKFCGTLNGYTPNSFDSCRAISPYIQLSSLERLLRPLTSEIIDDEELLLAFRYVEGDDISSEENQNV